MLTKQDYILKITNASPVGLVVISYEMFLEHISEAAKCEDCSGADFGGHIEKAREILLGLIGALDFEQAISSELYVLYMHVSRLLIGTVIYRHKSKLDEAYRIMSGLLVSWQTVAAGEKALKPSGNTRRVFSGLTYSKGGLDDFIADDENRGIKI